MRYRTGCTVVGVWLMSLLASFVEVEAVLVQVNSPVTLPCPGALNQTLISATIITKTWFKGYVNGTIDTLNPPRIFNQAGSGTLNRDGARDDMSLDTSTFAMTIGRVQVQDDGLFTCKIATLEKGTAFYQQNVEAFIQPTLQVTGLDTTTFMENDTVSMECIIESVYPRLGVGNFQLMWGSQEIMEVTPTDNPDGSFKYVKEYSQTVSRDDDRVVVNCTVTPLRGTPVTVTKTISVQYISGDPALLSVSSQNPYRDDKVTFTCGHGSVEANPPVNRVKWFKDGEVQDLSEGTLSLILTVAEEDSGVYSCQVGNIVGFSTISPGVNVSVQAISNPVPSIGPSIIPAAVGGAVGGVVFIVLIIVIVVVCRRKNSKSPHDDKGSSAALTSSTPGMLDRVVVPPEDNGEAQYSDIPPGRTKPIPAQRSFRKKPEPKPRHVPEPLYDNSRDNKVLYSNVGELNGVEPTYAQVGKPPAKPPRLHDVTNNNQQNKPEGIVYAELNLDKQGRQADSRGVMPPRHVEPTEYAQIDFTKSGKPQ